ncbi:MAG: sigma-70 family RNA polymerase sigma factor [Firmicutes bacterium]|nr:sigma-70 family RNA polymerase sigma factor [Bacillota bacterium]
MRIEIRGVEDLSFRERQVIVLKESGLGTAEIAARLGLAEATVNTLLHRARRKGYEVVIVLPGAVLGLPGEPREDGVDGDDNPSG